MKPKFCVIIFLLAFSNARAATESFQIDPVHTRVAFSVSHAGFSNPIGTFSGSDGLLKFDEMDWSKSSVSATIPLGTLNLGDTHWQEKILDSTFFDAQKFPVATFVSQRIEKLSSNTGIAHGVINIHGKSQPISLNFTLNALKRHPLNLKKTIGFSATATLSRKSFGINAWTTLIGDEVKIMIELEASRSKAEQTQEQANDTKK
ncbi:MAG: YceI family protein [Arenimonas sp.]